MKVWKRLSEEIEFYTVIALITFFLIFEQEVPHFCFILNSTNYVVSPITLFLEIYLNNQFIIINWYSLLL